MENQEVQVAPDAITSPVSIKNDTVQAPPTYTTAGTIYNPASAAPLQPPLRRGRSLKNQSDRSITAFSYTTQAYGENQGYSQSAHEQYSPLQQNYDRAARPQERVVHAEETSTTPIGPRMHSGNMPSAPRSVRSDMQMMQNNIDGSSSSDDDFNGSEPSALKSMNVKSLQNLASYPNPSQSAARRVLAQGGLNGRRLVERQKSRGPEEAEALASDTRSQELGNGSPSPIRPEQKHPSYAAALGQDLNDTDLDRPHQDDPDNHPVAIKSGARVPRPITAGPPGQRQYRVSNRNDGWVAPSSGREAFSEESPAQHLNYGLAEWHDDFAKYEETLAAANGSYSWPALGTENVALGDIGRTECFQTHGVASIPSSVEPLPAAYPWNTTSSSRSGGGSNWMLERQSGSYGVIGDSRPQFEGRARATQNAATLPKQGPRLSPEGFEYKSISEIGESDPLPPTTVPAYRDAERTNDPWALACVPSAALPLADRLRHVNHCWYEGTNMLGNSSCYLIQDLRGKKKNPLGAIGDGRPVKKKDVTQPKPEPMTIEQAKEKPTPEHIDPLLQMLFASFVVNLETEKEKTEKEQNDSKTDI